MAGTKLEISHRHFHAVCRFYVDEDDAASLGVVAAVYQPCTLSFIAGVLSGGSAVHGMAFRWRNLLFFWDPIQEVGWCVDGAVDYSRVR